MRFKIYLGILIIVHLVGAVALSLGFQEQVLPLSSLNLMLSGILVFSMHESEPTNRAFWAMVALVFAGGILIEILGVSTGKIFGSYSYGDSLGYKIQGVPWVIGLNWAMLSYASCALFSSSGLSLFIRSFLAAMVMVFIDFLIEPVAPILDFWTFEGGHAPIANYLAWFAAAWFFCGLILSFRGTFRNRLAIYLLILQSLFFLCLNLFL